FSPPPPTHFNRPLSWERLQSMSLFRRYLDREPVPLSQDSDVVSYFALPHVPDPSTHPAFEPLFEDAW
ncbi:unnamed protein product, partial [Hapterophycus canaliculatus]